jgi:hypothetical protein
MIQLLVNVNALREPYILIVITNAQLVMRLVYGIKLIGHALHALIILYTIQVLKNAFVQY